MQIVPWRTRAELLARAGLAAGRARRPSSKPQPPDLATGRRARPVCARTHRRPAHVVPARLPLRGRSRGDRAAPARARRESRRLPARERGAAERRPRARPRARTSASTPRSLALTDSTTMGLGLLYGGLRLAPDEEVLTTEHDFYATHEALRLPRRSGAPRAALRRPGADDGRRDRPTAPRRRRRARASSRSPGCTRAPA